jgi:hypothetical protein
MEARQWVFTALCLDGVYRIVTLHRLDPGQEGLPDSLSGMPARLYKTRLGPLAYEKMSRAQGQLLVPQYTIEIWF